MAEPARMSRDEFLVGWNVLVAQPWGRAYRIIKDESSAKMAATQLEFYHRKLERYPYEMWMVAAEIFAQGDHWPSLEEIRTTLNNSLPPKTQKEITHQNGAEMPEPIALGFAYAKANRVSFTEGMQAVLPGWLREFPDHDDAPAARQWWEQYGQVKVKSSVMSGLNDLGKEKST